MIVSSRVGVVQRRHLIGIDRAPILLAAAVPGPLVRAYVVDGAVTALLALASPRRDGLEQLETILPVPREEVAGWQTIGAAVSALGLRWAMVSVVATPEGPVFYDVEPDPVLTDLPVPFRDGVLDSLAAALLGRPQPDWPALAPQSRPTLLLRRMLAIQFEMEFSSSTSVATTAGTTYFLLPVKSYNASKKRNHI